jgi:hypothetical protein
MRVTRWRVPGGTSRTSAGESKALPPCTAIYTVSSGSVAVEPEGEVEIDGDGEEELEAEVEVEATVAPDRSTAL